MSYDTAKPFLPEGIFSGGYVDNTPEHSLQDRYSPFSRNTRLNWKATEKRPGHSRIVTLTAWDHPRGIWAARDYLIVRHNQWGNNNLVRINPDNSTVDIDTGTSITSSNRMFFQNTGDGVYTMNWVDQMWLYDGNSFRELSRPNRVEMTLTSEFPANTISIARSDGTFTSTVNSFDGRDWVIFEQIWANFATWETIQVFISWQSNPETRVIESVIRIEYRPAFSTTFSDSLWLAWWWLNDRVAKSDANDFNRLLWGWADIFRFNDPITALTSSNQSLYIFSARTISAIGDGDITDTGWLLSFNTRSITAQEWAANNACTVQVGYNVYYLTPSNKINQLARGNNLSWFEVLELSERDSKGVSEILGTLDPDQSTSFGQFYPRQNIIKWHLRVRWSSNTNIVITYDLTKDSFLVDDNQFFFDWVHSWETNYTISSIEPEVYIDETGTDDNWSIISFRYETRNFDLGSPTIKKELWESRMYTAINRSAELIQQIQIDWAIIDSRQVDRDNIPIAAGWVGTAAIWTTAVWTWGWFRSDSDDLFNVDIIRTKWHLQVKWNKIKWIFTENTLWWKVRLEWLDALIEVLPRVQSELTR